MLSIARSAVSIIRRPLAVIREARAPRYASARKPAAYALQGCNIPLCLSATSSPSLDRHSSILHVSD